MRDHVLPAESALGELVWNAGQVAGRAFDRYMRAAGGSRPQFYVLSVLSLRPTASQSDIAGAVGVEGPTVTRHLDAMESEGLIVRIKDHVDRRVTRVEMTAEGVSRYEVLRRVADRFNEDYLGFLPQDSIAQLRLLLTALVETGERLVQDSELDVFDPPPSRVFRP